MRSRRSVSLLHEASCVAWTLVAAWSALPGGLGLTPVTVAALAVGGALLAVFARN